MRQHAFFTPPTSELTTGVPKIIASPTEIWGIFNLMKEKQIHLPNKYCYLHLLRHLNFPKTQYYFPDYTVL